MHANGGREQEPYENNGVSLDLSLALPGLNNRTSSTPPLARAGGIRRGRGQKKMNRIPTPYPWATDRRAKVQSLHDLMRKGIRRIKGKVRCNECHVESEMEYDLVEKFKEVASFIAGNDSEMHNRAPHIWMFPRYEDCRRCERRGCVRPEKAEKKKKVNWLFLFLGQTIGICNLAELKYYCKYTENHKTGAKNRLLYTAYITLCNQLLPIFPLPNGHHRP